MKPGDLAKIRWSSSLFETPALTGLPNNVRGVARTNELVVLVNFVEGRTFTQILHTEHGLKWVITNSLDILKRSENV
jgi:hypothetical protein